MPYAPEMQVKKFLGDVRTSRGQWWRVFTTGRAGWILMCAVTGPGGIDMGFHHPFKRSAFKRGFLPRER